MLGAIRASPSAAAWMAWTSRAGPASLSRNPRAPARRAPLMYSSVSKVVITTTASGSGTSVPASRRVASTPSRRGIRMSSRHTSGRSRWASATASRPSAAWAITSMLACPPRMVVRPARMMSWSSAIKTRMLMRCLRSGGSSPRRPTLAPVLDPPAAFLRAS